MNLADIWKALQLGREIKNPATWKNRQSATNALAAMLAFVYAALPSLGVSVVVSPADQISIASGLAAMLALMNLVFTTITSKKVGIPASIAK